MKRTFSVDEAAARLGVKRQTVYAYVSRGLLSSRRGPNGRSSRFDADQVERLARGRRRPAPGVAGLTVETELTVLEGHRLYYRGHDVAELARSQSFEAVAHWLWTGTSIDADGAEAPPPLSCAQPIRQAVARAVGALSDRARPLDRQRVGVATAAAEDALRRDLRPVGVVAAAGTIVGVLTEAIDATTAAATDGPEQALNDARIASRLWHGLSDGRHPAGGVLTAVNGALVLLADHDLAASTLAARVAASTRADPYAVVLAALGALDGPGHGSASAQPYELLTRVAAGDSPADVLAAGLAPEGASTDGQPPGFGHFLYPEGDPRATVLLELVAAADVDKDRLAAVVRTRSAAMERGWYPNIDFALASLAFVSGLPSSAGETIFAVARTAGWLAHAIEEYAAPAGRFRPRGRYVGVPPEPDR